LTGEVFLMSGNHPSPCPLPQGARVKEKTTDSRFEF
jgi:hypothetical protein